MTKNALMMVVRSYEKSVFLLSIAVGLTAHLLFLRQEFFMDEAVILGNVLHFLKNTTLSPVNGIYPTFFAYVSAPLVAATIAMKSVFVDYGLKETAAYLYTFDQHYLILPARIISNISLIASAMLFSAFATKRFDVTAGLFTGALIIVSPIFLRYGSYGLPDITVMLFSTVSLLFCIKAIERSEDFERFSRYVIFAAIGGGLATATKYNGAAIAFPIVSALSIGLFKRSQSTLRLFALAFLAAAVGMLAFVAASPSWVIATDTMMGGLQFLTNLADRGHQGTAGVPLLGQIELLLTRAPVELLLAISSLCFYSKKHRSLFLFSGSLIAGTLVVSITTSVQTTRYLFPMFPALYVLCAFSLNMLFSRFTRVAVYGAGAVLFSIATYSFYLSSAMFQDNNAAAARQWMYDNVAEHTKIATEKYYVPYLYSDERLQNKEYLLEYPAVTEELRERNVFYDVGEIEYAQPWIRETDARYIVTSEGVYRRFFENGLFTRIAPDPDTVLGREYQAKREFYGHLLSGEHYKVKKRFSSRNGAPVTILERQEP